MREAKAVLVFDLTLPDKIRAAPANKLKSEQQVQKVSLEDISQCLDATPQH